MKKIILACAAYLMTMSVYAQSDSSKSGENPNDLNNYSNNKPNYIISQDANNPNKDSNTANPKFKNTNVGIDINPNGQDSMYTVKPSQSVKKSTPARSVPVVKPYTPVTQPVEKSAVEIPKDKNMYLVSDSTKKKVEKK